MSPFNKPWCNFLFPDRKGKMLGYCNVCNYIALIQVCTQVAQAYSSISADSLEIINYVISEFWATLFTFHLNKIQQNTSSVFLHLLIVLRMSFRQFQWISLVHGRLNINVNWNSLESPETDSEGHQEIQEDTVSILLDFIMIKSKTKITQQACKQV